MLQRLMTGKHANVHGARHCGSYFRHVCQNQLDLKEYS